MTKQQLKGGDSVQVRMLAGDNFGYDWIGGYRYGSIDDLTGKHFVVSDKGGVSLLSSKEFKPFETELEMESRLVKEIQIAITGCDIPSMAYRLFELGVTASQLTKAKGSSND